MKHSNIARNDLSVRAEYCQNFDENMILMLIEGWVVKVQERCFRSFDVFYQIKFYMVS